MSNGHRLTIGKSFVILEAIFSLEKATVHRFSFFTTKVTKNHEEKMKKLMRNPIVRKNNGCFIFAIQNILENFVVLRVLRGEKTVNGYEKSWGLRGKCEHGT
jgi:hypothetical protein